MKLNMIPVCALLTALSVEVDAQMKIIPRERLDSIASPQLSQTSSRLRFDTYRIEAPAMTEDDPPAVFTYRMTNTGDSAVSVGRLTTSCSCVGAVCDRKLLNPGDSASVKVTYYPAGHPGRFERRIFVYAEGEDKPAALLTLAVEVKAGSDLSGLYPVQIGPLRLRRSEVSFVFGKKAVETLRVVNAASRPVRLQCDGNMLPEGIAFSAEPKDLAPSEEGMIRIEYDPDVSSRLRPLMKVPVILSGLGLPPGKSSIIVKITEK